MNKKLLSLLLVLTLIIIPIKAIAVEGSQKQTYTVELKEAYSKAIAKANEFNINDKSLYDLLKTYGYSTQIHDRSPYNMEQEFNRLYSKLKSTPYLQSYEQGELVMYYAIFKDSEIFKGKSLSPKIYPDEFPNCEVWEAMMQLKISKESMRTVITSNVMNLYNSLLSIIDNVNIMTELTKISELEFKEATIKYKNGDISELKRAEVESNYNIQKLELKKLLRSKENIERSLKNILGINFNDELQIKSYKVTEKELLIPDYETCIKKALLNRKEIALQKVNLHTAKVQRPILEDLSIDKPKVESLKMQLQEHLLTINELEDAIEEQENIVTQDINSKYAEVDYQKKNLSIEKIKLDAAKKSLDKVNTLYSSGNVSNKDLANAKIAYQRATSTYDNATRELAYRIIKLNNACGVG